jgi:squalene-hopene/tetraprenyl-beta-curcumene cyclase
MSVNAARTSACATIIPMVIRIVSVLALAVAPGFCGDWNPRLAADYLDARQKAWFAWPAAQKGENGVCLSCHTGLSYLLARPALSRKLGENEPTPYETGLLAAVKKRVAKKTTQEYSPDAKEPHASEALGVESVLSALLLASQDARHGALSKEAEQAFDRLWSLQIRDSKNQGAWIWNSFELDPWEEPHSMFYGASLAALAVGVAPSGYQSRPAVQENVEALRTYLRKQQPVQPLHNRLILMWASTKLGGTLTEAERKGIVDEVLGKQQADGGWTLESLGAWTKHANAPPAEGSNSYATALVAFVLEQAGLARKNPGVAQALGWLRSHQDPKTGFWDAQSMNKRYAPDSMPFQFMRDAATSYASLALVE